MPSPAIRQLLEEGYRALIGDEARLEAELLLAHVLNRPRTHLHAWPERVIEAEEAEHYRMLVGRRTRGEPLAYLTGWREFWSLRLRVTPAVLIPRPETELLVELALSYLPPDRPARVADLGTGSGAVAAAIASERPACHITAVEADPDALAVAEDNFRRLELANVNTVRAEWCEALPSASYDLMVSNPPYVAESDPHLNQGDLRYEPRQALVAGPQGLDAIRHISQQAVRPLKPQGKLLLEHGYDQGAAVRGLLCSAGFGDVITRSDLAGHERVTLGSRP